MPSPRRPSGHGREAGKPQDQPGVSPNKCRIGCFGHPGKWNRDLNMSRSDHPVTVTTAGFFRRPDGREGAVRFGYPLGWEGDHLRHRRQRHDESGIDEPLEVGCESLGESPVADEDACLDVPVECIRGEVRGGDEDLLVVVDDRLGVEHRPWAITRVDGTWVVVDVRTAGTGPVPLEVRGEADGDRVGCRRIAMPEFDAGELLQRVNLVTRLVNGRSSPFPHMPSGPGDHRLGTRLTRVNRKVASDRRDTRTSSPGCAR